MDIGSIQAAVGGLKTATDIVNSFLKLKLTAEMQSKVIELQGVILSAQSSALAAHSDQFTLLDRVRELETKIAKLEAWETEKKRYALTEVTPGTFAYVVKREACGAEPLHAICPGCYERGIKGVLQFMTDSIGTVHFKCNQCKAEITGYSNDQFKLVDVAT